jgi:hypothetical protein
MCKFYSNKKVTQIPQRLGTEKELIEKTICFTAGCRKYVAWGSEDIRTLSVRKKKLPFPRIESKLPAHPTRSVVTIPTVPTRSECHIEILYLLKGF